MKIAIILLAFLMAGITQANARSVQDCRAEYRGNIQAHKVEKAKLQSRIDAEVLKKNLLSSEYGSMRKAKRAEPERMAAIKAELRNLRDHKKQLKSAIATQRNKKRGCKSR